jgi:glycosyltransferase involved in cell wall biosynthesis
MIPKGPVPPDISVIITAHHEGRLSHRSARSAQRAARFARAAGIEVEIIGVLDCPSEETLTYFAEWEEIFEKVTRIEVRDPGLARNHGVGIASGRYIAFLNAGDLFSENWLARAFHLVVENSATRLVLHPELNVYFSREEVYVETTIDSDGADYSPLELMQFNPWTSRSFVSRDFFLDGNVYAAASGGGFGHQNWLWNCEVIGNGAVHRFVPATAHFIRLSRDQATPREQTFGPSKLFHRSVFRTLVAAGSPPPILNTKQNEPAGSPNRSNSVEGAASTRSRSLFRRRLKNGMLGLMRPWPRLIQFCVDINGAVRNYWTPPVNPSRPRPLADCEWLAQEWTRIHQVDTELFPTSTVVEKLDRRAVPRSTISCHYPELEELIGDSPTHVYLLPWLMRGGADIEAIEFMTAVRKANSRSRIACILTEDCDSPWLTKLPVEIRVIELGKLLRGFSANEKASILLRLLIQKRPRVIHNINSALGYKLFTKNGSALASQSNLFASLFGFEFLPNGELGGYAVWDLSDCLDYLSRALTDSRWFADRLCDMYGFQRSRFSVMYVPAPSVSNRKRFYDGKGVLNILWASRFWREKRPDVLCEVASRLAGLPFHFHIYGADISGSAMREIFERLSRFPNVTTYGSYDGFGSLPTDEYDVFLYTSERDGMPNVLLEAAAAGLPVIAPDVGGIKEFINDDTGFLVSGPEESAEYVRHLEAIQRNYQIVVPKIESAQRLIESRHSWASFVSAIEQLPGYLD